MTEQQNPITPPPELRAQWRQEAPRYRDGGVGREDWLIDSAAQWGADQELEACCEWNNDYRNGLGKQLRDARRPKPLSLKEQALVLIDGCTDPEGDYLDDNALSLIRRALEQLDD